MFSNVLTHTHTHRIMLCALLKWVGVKPSSVVDRHGLSSTFSECCHLLFANSSSRHFLPSAGSNGIYEARGVCNCPAIARHDILMICGVGILLSFSFSLAHSLALCKEKKGDGGDQILLLILRCACVSVFHFHIAPWNAMCRHTLNTLTVWAWAM